MVTKYQVFREEKLLIQKYNGLFSMQSYMRYIPVLINRTLTEKIDKILIDLREAILDKSDVDFHIQMDKVTDVWKKVNQNEIKRDNIKRVFLVDKPLPTVVAHLFAEKFSAMNYRYCSTLSSAIETLQLSYKEDDLEYLINNLENTIINTE